MTPLVTISDYARAARDKLSDAARRYYRSGSDAQRTLRANRRAYQHYELWYRVLVNVSERSLATSILGTPVAFPILVAPTAYHKLAHADGEIGSARASAAAGTIFTLSTLATTSLEDVAASCDGPRWFQLYVHKDRGLTRSLVERAAAAGYRALMLTVDTPVLGRRVRDERHGFALPPGLEMSNLVNAPGFSPPVGSALSAYVASRHDPSLTWKDLDWLRSLSSLPLVLKGIVRADDARRAAQEGAAAVIVSNHGGRQLDSAPGTLDALPGCVNAVAGRCEVYLDGGIRWGTDVVKALGLGARAVLVGRPILWGLAVDGERGVAAVLALLRDELSRAMALCGCASLATIDQNLVRRRAL